MQIRLRIVHGQFQNRQGTDAGHEVVVNRLPFLIGSGGDCHMRCKSSLVSTHHCVLRAEERTLHVFDLGSETGTFVDGERVADSQPLPPGSHLKVGRLEFEMLYDPAELDYSALHERPADPVGDVVSELLTKADEEERLKRQFDPKARQFQVEASPAGAEEADESEQRLEQLKQNKRKPPGKLPPRPGITAPDSVNAADEALKRMFKKK